MGIYLVIYLYNEYGSLRIGNTEISLSHFPRNHADVKQIELEIQKKFGIHKAIIANIIKLMSPDDCIRISGFDG